MARQCRTTSDALALVNVIPSLVTMSKENATKTEGEVRILLFSLLNFLNLARTIEGEQISETAQLIVEEFYYMTLADLAVAFKQIKLGRYGKFYEGIDGTKLIQAIREYEEDRANAAQQVSHNRIHEQKENDGVPIPDEVAEKIKEAFAPKPKETEPVNQQTQIKNWAEEYWKLEREWRVEHPEENRYKFEKEYMTLEQFIKNKIEDEPN